MESEKTFYQKIIEKISNIIKKRRQEKEDRQKAIAMQQLQSQFVTMRISLSNLFALALSQVPPHMIFYGTVNANMLNLQYANNTWRVVIACNITNGPNNFHAFQNTLQNVCANIRQTALFDLQNQIYADRYQFQCDYVAYLNSNVWQGKQFASYLQDYTSLYRSNYDRFFYIHIISIKYVSGGIAIDFSATFNDGGLSPNNYSL